MGKFNGKKRNDKMTTKNKKIVKTSIKKWYPITPLNGAPRITVHAPLSGCRCMHCYAGLFRKLYCYCKSFKRK